MLSFAVFHDGKPAESVEFAGAYLIGSDDVPLRAEFSFGDGVIQCTKRAAGPAGLVILWDVADAGKIMTSTVRLQERKEPYVLQVELARGRLLRTNQKIEDWGLLDFPEAKKELAAIAQARDQLIKALQGDTPAQMATLAEKSLSQAVIASEALSRFHADSFLKARRQSKEIPKLAFGCGIHLAEPTDLARERISNAFDFITVPVGWRDIEPSEQTFNWKPLDAWIETLTKANIPIKGSALLSFSEGTTPDWLYMWEHDFDTIRDLAFEHMRRVINRYGQYIQVWDVISGIHANNCFSFNFEQLMELTRMSAALMKQTAPQGQAIIEINNPWGEYYSKNQRTIPPLLYADMVVQSGIGFDAFGLRFEFGSAQDGYFARDMFQISSMLDAYSKLSKPIHVTASQVPSKSATGQRDAVSQAADGGGFWREPWNEETQSCWLREFVAVAMSKPYVESVSWEVLADHPGQRIPHGGLLRSDLAPKLAYQELTKVRSALRSGRRAGEKKVR